MDQAPKSIYELVWFGLGAIIMLLIHTLTFFLKKDSQKSEKAELALNENTHAILKLTLQMELVLKQLEKLPEIEKDLNLLGAKVRDLSMNNNNSQD